MILKLNNDKTLSYYKKTSIYVGEKDFDKIEVFIPDFIGDYSTSELVFVAHLVNEKGEYLKKTFEVESINEKKIGTITVTPDITQVEDIFDLYIEMVKGDNEVIGKTNIVKVNINPLPDEKDRIRPKEEYEEIIDELDQHLVENTEAMNRINEFEDGEDGKSAYEIALDNGFVGTEEEWLESLKGDPGATDYSELSNQPSINGNTLTGNKTFRGLGLGSELKADSPIYLQDSDGKIHIGITPEKTLSIGTWAFSSNYDVDNFDSSNRKTIILTAQKNRFSHIPSFVQNKYNTDISFIQIAGYHTYLSTQILQWIDDNNNGHTAMRLIDTYSSVIKRTDWTEIKNSVVTSAVVNQNGTITFTNSDGSTFTTTGASVIGPQGDPGHDWIPTESELNDIAQRALTYLPSAEEVAY